MKTLRTRLALCYLSLIVVGLLFTNISSANHLLPHLTEHIIGVWLFEEKSGKTVLDSSGNGNHGILVGPSRTAGKFGRGLKFKEGEYVDFEKSLLNDLPEFTMVAWVNRNVWENLDSEGIMGQHNVIQFGVSRRNALLLRAFPNPSPDNDPGAKAVDCVGDNMCIAVETNIGPQDKSHLEGVWAHVEATGDAERMNSFLDAKGAFKRIRKLTIKWPGTYGTSKATTKLGANMFVPRGAGWHGMMDEVAIFSKALTKDELRTISKNGLGETVLPVEPAGKLAVTWGQLKIGK